MVTALPETAAAPGGSPVRPRGILAVASPAPEGWEAGGLSVSSVCADPIIETGCITLGEPSTASRPQSASFYPFLIRQGSGCSTLSGGDRASQAREALISGTEYALGLTLATGGADGQPSLADATELGGLPGAVAAVAALECAAAEAGAGQEYALHASVGAAPYLADAGLIDSAGRSPSGATWIISPGYPCPATGADARIWATGRVWAGVGAVDVQEAVDRRMNDREAWAARSAIVGFGTCINFTATFPRASAD